MTKHAELPAWEDKSPDQKIDHLHNLILDLYRYALFDSQRAIIDTLTQHPAADQKEKDDIDRMIGLLHEHPNIINKACEVGHITGSALIVDVTGQRVLLHFHRTLQRWLQVGGHAEYETLPHDIALREAREESGLTDLRFFPQPDQPALIDVDIHVIPQRNNTPEHLHLDFRYAFSTQQPEAVHGAAGESDQFMWLPLADLDRYQTRIDAQLMRCLLKIRQLVAS